jgi:mRNA interferase RelE/StbE
MNIQIDKSFEKDIKKIKDKDLLAKIANTIEQIQASSTKEEITNIKKLKGFQSYYRIRIGDYRIGLAIEGTTVDFIRFLPRKDV